MKWYQLVAGVSGVQAALMGVALVAFSAPSGLLAQSPAGAASARPRPYVRAVQEILESHVAEDEPSQQALSDREVEQRNELLQSDAMIEALVWLDQYFAVQVDYSPAQVAEFRQRLRRMSPMQLRMFLSRLQRERSQWRQQHQSAERLRDQNLVRTARWQRDEPQRHQPAGFGRGTLGSGPAGRWRHDRYRVPAPLITSRDVAVLTLYRVIYDD